jgi:hypothetical protein
MTLSAKAVSPGHQTIGMPTPAKMREYIVQWKENPSIVFDDKIGPLSLDSREAFLRFQTPQIQPFVHMPEINAREISIYHKITKNNTTEFCLRLVPDTNGEKILIQEEVYLFWLNDNEQLGSINLGANSPLEYDISIFGSDMTVEKLFKLPVEDVFERICEPHKFIGSFFDLFLFTDPGRYTQLFLHRMTLSDPCPQ